MAVAFTSRTAAPFARTLLFALALLPFLATPAGAAVKRAGSVLPPGQSGFVSNAGVADGSGSPHLYDQTDLFVRFDFKDALFGQPGEEESPRAGVRIVRDSFGVPAITADNQDGVWFGAGYAVAQDRLFQLELFRRATTGRLSEILGRSFLQMDIETRRDYFTGPELDAQLAKLPPDLRARFDSYRDGINAWIVETRMDPNKLPGEFTAVGARPDDWTSRDSAAIGVFLARTVPSGDGEELNNARGLQTLGPKLFNRLLPLRTPGQVSTIPRSEGLFPSRPGRSLRQERAAFTRSRSFVKGLPLEPTASPSGTSAAREAVLGQLGRTGGSNMWAIRSKGRKATLFNGPQLGFQVPELFVEFEVHGGGLDVRGVTAPGVPVIGIGHNGRVAWGLTSGLSDEDDLYAEKLVGEEQYRFRGKVEQMNCRDETFTFRSPPTDFIPSTSDPLGGLIPDPTKPTPPDVAPGSETRRLCRTRHGPVQARGDGVAYSRKFAIFGREVETLEGLALVNEARSIRDVDKAIDKVTWNENLMAADSSGNIGYWHPGLLPVKPKGYDERLPYPGTGEAEWAGLLPPDKRPQVINPKQGYLFQWNNVPSQGWTSGDGPARERLTGPFHRAAFLARRVGIAKRRGGGYDQTKAVDRVTGTVAQQRPLAARRLRTAQRRAKGSARTVLATILSWDGSYNRTDGSGRVEPGVAAWEAFKDAAAAEALSRPVEDVKLLDGGASSSHEFDATNSEGLALRTLTARGYRRAAAAAYVALVKRFSSGDPAAWREPRRMYEPEAQGAGSFDPFPFFDRGTWQQIVELGPGA